VHEDLKSGTLETAFEKAWFSSHPFHGTAEFAAQVWKIEATQVAQLDAFELLPEPLTRIQFRSIGRQTLYMQPLCCTIREELSDGTAAVDGSATPDDDHAAGALAQQVLEKRDHVMRGEGALLAVQVQLTRWRQGADGREMITRPPLLQNGRLAHRGRGPDDTRQGVEPRFIYQEDGLALGLCPLLMARQVSSRQCALAASSR
jgi:hypothetical protein